MKVSEYLDIPESTEPRLDQPVRVDESALVLGDVELPFQNAEFVNDCITLALAWGIKACIWAGDFLHWGAFAHFLESDKGAEEELERVEDLIGPFLSPFDRIVWISGNHDRRPQRMLDRFINLKKMARLVVPPELALEFERKVTVSDLFYCHVGDEWQIEHPQATNKVPANAARGLSNIHDRSILMSHNHLLGMQQSDSGKHLAFEIGCCVDPRRLAYYQARHTNRPRMTNGAAILRKVGTRYYPHLLSPTLTDWEWERRACQSENRERKKSRGRGSLTPSRTSRRHRGREAPRR